MACPQCRGTSRQELAPGYFHCTSAIDTRLPGPAQYGQPGPPVVVNTRICGNTYQEAAPGLNQPAVCGCGTFAIGLCLDCDRPVCGSCSAMVDNSRVCQACLPAAQQRASAAAQVRQAEQRRRDEGEWLTTRERQVAIQRSLEEAHRAAESHARRLVQRLVAAGCPEAIRVPRAPMDRTFFAKYWRAWPLRELRSSEPYDANGPPLPRSERQVITERGDITPESLKNEQPWWIWDRAVKVLTEVCGRHGIPAD